MVIILLIPASRVRRGSLLGVDFRVGIREESPTLRLPERSLSPEGKGDGCDQKRLEHGVRGETLINGCCATLTTSESLTLAQLLLAHLCDNDSNRQVNYETRSVRCVQSHRWGMDVESLAATWRTVKDGKQLY